MKKVCVITTVHQPFDARIYFRECSSLSKFYDVTLIHPIISEKIESKGGKIKLVGIKSGGRLTRLFKGYGFFRSALKTKSELYHFHDLEFAFWAALIKLITSKPVIYDSHELHSLTLRNREWLPGAFEPLVVFLVKFYEKAFVPFFSAVVVAAPAQVKYYKSPLLLLNLPTRGNYEHYQEKKDYNKCVYVGSITKSRALRIVSELAKMAKHYKIYLVGKADSQFPKIENVKYLGFVPNDKLSKRLSGIGVGVVPFINTEQYKLSVPSKIFDYLAMGMIVVVPEFIKEGIAGIGVDDYLHFVSGDSDSFHEELEAISAKPEQEKRRESKRNRAAFLRNYSWQTEEIKLLELYKRLLGESK